MRIILRNSGYVAAVLALLTVPYYSVASFAFHGEAVAEPITRLPAKEPSTTARQGRTFDLLGVVSHEEPSLSCRFVETPEQPHRSQQYRSHFDHPNEEIPRLININHR